MVNAGTATLFGISCLMITMIQSAFVDTTPGPQCLNEICCFKHRNMLLPVNIAHDNCVIFNCTFTNVTVSNIIVINSADNILIGSNTFETASRAISIAGGSTNTRIYNNVFSDLLQGVYILNATNTTIKNNTFADFTLTGNRAIYEPYDLITTRSNGLHVEGNTIQSVGTAMELAKDIGTVTILNNYINTTTANGIMFSSRSTGAVVEGNTLTNIGEVGIKGAQKDNDFQILNNYISNTGGNAIEAYGRNVFVSGNTLRGVGKGVYIYSYGTITRNKIYNARDVGIYVDGSSTTGGGEVIVENNMIYDVLNGNEAIEFDIYQTSFAPQWVYIRFNTILINNLGGKMSIQLGDNGAPPNFLTYDLYCNLVLANSFWQTSLTHSYANEYGNLKYAPSEANKNLSSFVNSDFTDLDSVDLHLQSDSSAIHGCDGLDTATYPLPPLDFDGIARSEAVIDVGADQKSVAPTTAGPTSSPSTSTSAPSGVTSAPSGVTSAPSRVTSAPSTSAPSGVTSAPSGVTSAPTGVTPAPTGVTPPPTGVTPPAPSGVTSDVTRHNVLYVLFVCAILSVSFY
eukprot:253605_1